MAGFSQGRENKNTKTFTVARDAISPTLTLETTIDGNDVRATWEASDTGSSLRTCELEIRDGDGPWQQLSTACAGSATHPGEPGHLYTLRLAASNNVGSKASADVTNNITTRPTSTP